MPDKPGILRNLRIKRVALVDAGANFDKHTGDGAHIMLFKSATPKQPVAETNTETNMKKSFIQKILGLVTETDPTKRAAAAVELEKEFPADDDVEKVHKAGDAMCKCADCMNKRAPDPEVAKRLTDIEKANTDLAKKLADSQTENLAVAKRLVEEIEKRESVEMREVLKSFKATPFDLDKDVPVYLAMKRATPEAFDRTMTMLKATDAQLAQSALFANFGTGRTGQGSAWAQIEAKADAMVTKSATPLTREQAIEKVMVAEPKLVAQYRAEQQ